MVVSWTRLPLGLAPISIDFLTVFLGSWENQNSNRRVPFPFGWDQRFWIGAAASRFHSVSWASDDDYIDRHAGDEESYVPTPLINCFVRDDNGRTFGVPVGDSLGLVER